jgi:type II secretory pathway pseudopilin PulG
VTRTRSQQPPSDQGGFILIEVLVSAVILALVAGAVLTLFSATTRSAASERDHSVAYGIAQEDQARLRSMRLSSLNRLAQTRPISLDGGTFTVESTGVFVNNETGSESCTQGSSSADYIRITSTVTGPGMVQPVVLQSIVSPSNGSLDPTHGTLSFNATNGAGQPLSGVSISGSGTANFNGSTDFTGCANFADLPAGNYKFTTSAAGMINMRGETSTTKEIGVPSAGTQNVLLQYDRPGSIKASFRYPLANGTGYAAAKADSIEVFNAESGISTPTVYWTASHVRGLGVEATSLFPFKNSDAVYAGACAENNPNPKGEVNAPGAGALSAVLVSAGGVAEPVITMPALFLTVKNSSTLVTGARVTITDESCQETSGTHVKRIYTTNAGGNPSETTAGPAEPALPWGTYEICASATFKEGSLNVIHRIKKGKVAVQNLSGGTALSLDLSGSGWEKGSACP